jgi:hypothetical protein
MLDIKKQAHDMLQIAMDTSDSVTAVQYAYTKSIIDTHESSHLQFSTHNNPFTTHVNMHVGIDVLQKIIRIDNDIHTNDFKILSHIDCSCRLELIVAIYTDPNRVLDKCATEFCMVMDLAVREIRTTYRCAILALSRYAGIHEYLRDYLIAWF